MIFVFLAVLAVLRERTRFRCRFRAIRAVLSSATALRRSLLCVQSRSDRAKSSRPMFSSVFPGFLLFLVFFVVLAVLAVASGTDAFPVPFS